MEDQRQQQQQQQAEEDVVHTGAVLLSISEELVRALNAHGDRLALSERIRSLLSNRRGPQATRLRRELNSHRGHCRRTMQAVRRSKQDAFRAFAAEYKRTHAAERKAVRSARQKLYATMARVKAQLQSDTSIQPPITDADWDAYRTAVYSKVRTHSVVDVFF